MASYEATALMGPFPRLTQHVISSLNEHTHILEKIVEVGQWWLGGGVEGKGGGGENQFFREFKTALFY